MSTLLVVLTGAVAACSGASTDPAAAPSVGPKGFTPPFEAPSEVDPELLLPLAGAGLCTATPDPATDAEQPDGLIIPTEAIVTSVEPADPLTRVQGYIPWTPVQYRVWLQFIADVEVIQVEDEVREAEALTSDGTNRMFVKAQAICEMGSVFVAVIAPEVADAELPTPAGTGP